MKKGGRGLTALLKTEEMVLPMEGGARILALDGDSVDEFGCRRCV